MRKVICTFVMLLAVAAALTMVPAANAAGGGGLGCTYMCDCAGRALKCCPKIGGGTSCSPTDEFGCPQVYNC